MAEPVNLVLGDCGGGHLRHAAHHHGLRGEVHVIPDDLGHGPLDDGVERLAYMHRCFAGCADWNHAETDAFAAWHRLAELQAASPCDVVVWRGCNVSETTLLAMACWWLRGLPGRLAVVELPDGRHIGTFAPGELARLQLSRRGLSPARIDGLAADFERLREHGGLRRQWLGETVVTVPVAAFDHLLLAAMTEVFMPALHVIACAVKAADPRDGLSDIFLCSRIRALIATGQVEADRPPRLMTEYALRRSQS